MSDVLLIVLGVILLVFSLFLTVAILMQNGKSKNLSGVIAGGAETFFGKNKGSTIDKVLSRVTTIVAIIFVVAVVVVYVMQDTAVESYKSFTDAISSSATETEEVEEDGTAEADGTEVAETAAETETAVA